MQLHTVTPTKHYVEYAEPQFDIHEVYDAAHQLLPGVNIMSVAPTSSTLWLVLTFEPYYPEVPYAT